MDTNMLEARACIEKAIMLVGKNTVYTLLWNLTSPTPDSTTPAHSPAASSPTTPTEGRRRGRKPGAAENQNRCQWVLADKTQCKNGQQDTTNYCKIHLPKVHLLGTSQSSV